jgi:N-acetylglucosaminyldiphosphoundecaprenol N-acetyl-beta-D-mannosaminyltransferase
MLVPLSEFRRTTINVLGVCVQDVSLSNLIRRVEDFLASDGRYRVMYANAHVLNTAYQDPDLRRILNTANLVYCDGVGVRLGARLTSQCPPERLTGADWIDDLCRACEKNGHTLFILGGEKGVAEQATQVLRARYPGLIVAGTHPGFFNDGSAVIGAINRARPDILLVGLGTPLQEKWIDQHFGALETPVVWAVGALVDFIAGKVPRAPRWMSDHGFEWLFRLLIEPRRMWRRYLIGNPLFVYRILTQPRIDQQ